MTMEFFLCFCFVSATPPLEFKQWRETDLIKMHRWRKRRKKCAVKTRQKKNGKRFLNSKWPKAELEEKCIECRKMKGKKALLMCHHFYFERTQAAVGSVSNILPLNLTILHEALLDNKRKNCTRFFFNCFSALNDLVKLFYFRILKLKLIEINLINMQISFFFSLKNIF